MNRFSIGFFSPFLWLETLFLRIAYGFVRILIALRTIAKYFQGRIFLLTLFVLGSIIVITVTAIPVSSYLLGENMEVVAAVDRNPTNAGIITGKSNGSSPFSNIDASTDVFSSKAEAINTPLETALEHAVKHTDPTFVCPMHSEVTSDEPGTCPICGMDLVLLEASDGSGIVKISTKTMNALGVRTGTVDRRNIFRTIDTVGYISENEKNIRAVTLRTEGWIERLVVQSVGDRVREGDILAEVYSPKLVNAQEEYVQSLRLGNRGLVRASAERLLALGVSRRQLNELKVKRKVKNTVAIYAPQDGVISELNVLEGMQVSPSKVLFSIVDLSSIWLLVDVFERQSDWVKVGQKANASLPFKPDTTWKGKVEYVYPSIDSKTRSLKVRLRFSNPDQLLKPNMYADVRIFTNPRKNVLAIPSEAAIRTGEETHVIVALGEGQFIPMPIRTGIETNKLTEVLSGLNEGDEVVVSSQFMIDSEASLKAALMKMSN